MEQVEQRGENYCGIETGVRTAGREILSASVPELWTGVLMFYVWLCCHRYRTVEIPSFVNRVTQLLVGFICVCKIAKSVMSVRPGVPSHGTTHNHNHAHSKEHKTHTQKHDTLPQHQINITK